MNTTKSLRTYTKITLGTAGALAASSQADAAIVYFDVNPDQTFNITDTLNFGSINLGAGTYSLNESGGTTFGLDFVDADGGTGLVAYLNPLGNVQWGFTGSYIERLALTDSISGASAWSWGTVPAAYLFGGYAGGLGGNWGFGPNETKSGFAPLRIDAGGGNYNYGWVEVTVVSGNTFSPPYIGTADVTVTGFAFEDQVNAAILAGDTGGGPVPVPEPGQVAASLLLLAGIAGYFALRRRAGAASEPNGLHALALGARGIEEFRKNKAA